MASGSMTFIGSNDAKFNHIKTCSMLAAGMIQSAGEYFHISTQWANYAHKVQYRVLGMRHGQYLCENGMVQRMAKGHRALWDT